VWNRNIINSLDIVPQAWCTDGTAYPRQNLDTIPTIYNPASTASSLVDHLKVLINRAASVASTSGSPYIPLPSTSFTGTPVDPPQDINQWWDDVIQQHVAGYAKYFGLVLSWDPATPGVSRVKKEKIHELYPVICVLKHESDKAIVEEQERA